MPPRFARAVLAMFPALILACAATTTSSTPPPQQQARSEDILCATGMLPDAGRCVSTEPACPPKMHLEYGQGCVGDDYVPPPSVLAAAPVPDIEVTDVVVGSGARADVGSVVVVHYTGMLVSGEVFDSSRTRGRPFEAPIGKGMLIKGWEEGMIGMRVGGRRELRIAPSKGYGARGMPPKIPPNAVLVFDVELLGVK